ncbi:MAG: RDD family protein [Micrococcales bacterium]|nr:RDD family protein [Micrococcales bacterium]
MNELTATIDSPHDEVAAEQPPATGTAEPVDEPSAVIWRIYAATFDVAAVLVPALLVAWASGLALAITVGVAVLALQLVLQGRCGWTIAQRQMSLQLVDRTTGDPVGVLRAALRLFVVAAGGLVLYSIGNLVAWFVALLMLVVGALLVMLTPLTDRTGRRRGWHDQLTDSMVIDLGVPRPRKTKPASALGATGLATGLGATGLGAAGLGATGPGAAGLGATGLDATGLDKAPRPALLMWQVYAVMFDLAVTGGLALVAKMMVAGPSGTVLAAELVFCVLVAQMMLQGEQGWSVGQRIMVLRLVDRSTGEPVGMGRAWRRLFFVGLRSTAVLDLWVPPPMGVPPSRVRQPRASDLPVRGVPSEVIWRVYAAVFDVVVVLAPALLVAWAGGGMFLAATTGIAVLVLQLALQGRNGWTLAQLMMFLRTVDFSTHAPVGAGRATQRLFVVAAAGLAFGVTGSLLFGTGGLLLGAVALFVVYWAKHDASGRNRGWHDQLAGTEVLDVWGMRPEFEDTRSRQILAVWDEGHRTMIADLLLPDGSTRKVTGVVLIGRNPAAAPGQTVLRLEDESLAPAHLRLTVGPLAVWAEDLGAVSGSCVHLPDDTHETCLPGRHVQVPAGSVIEIGDARIGLRKVSG